MKTAMAVADNHALDKNHTLIAYPFSDIERLAALTEASLIEADEEECRKYAANMPKRPFAKGWLLDDCSRDQFFTLNQDVFTLWWNEKSQPAEFIFNQKNVAESFAWSSQGTFLASLHPQGCILWDVTAKEGLTRYRKLEHRNISLLHFSPNEKYVVTFSRHEDFNDEDNLYIWHASTGQRIWSMRLVPDAESPHIHSMWPFITWSVDDQYFAFGYRSALFIYRTSFDAPPSLITGKGPMRQEGVSGVCFAPGGQPWLAYWCPESANTPAKVAVLEVPSLAVVRSKNLFNLSSLQLAWQSKSDFLAVIVEKCKGKVKKVPIASTLEIFRMAAKDIPIQVVELEGTVSLMSWEPNGAMLALLEHDLTDPAKSFVKFLDCSQSSAIKTVEKLERKNVNRLIWSPKGKFIVLGGLENLAGHMEFWSVTDKGDLECTHSGDHYMATSIEWDPSGRFVLSYQSILRYQMESSYMIWDFRGHVLHRVPMEKLKIASWRPRPASLLTPAQQKDVMKKLKDYSIKFDQEDAARAEKWLKLGKATKLQMKDDWDAWRRLARSQWNLAPDVFAQTFAQESDITDWVEEVLEETEELLT